MIMNMDRKLENRLYDAFVSSSGVSTDSRRIENLNELERHIKAETPSKEKDEKKTAAKKKPQL